MTKELERRDHNMDSMNSAIEVLTKKVAGMESGAPAAQRPKGQDNWRPTHIVLGGWAPKTPNDTVEKETRLPTNRAYCPRLYGAIAKVEVLQVLLARTAFRWQCAMDANRSDAPPRWAVVERSPALEARSRRIRCAADWMNIAYPQMQHDTANGEIMKGPETITRLGRGAEMWTKGFAGEQAAGVEWTVFSEALKTALAK